MITFLTTPRRPILKALSKSRWAALGVGLLLIAACSSNSDGGNACAKYGAQCGRTCSTDTDCGMGLYCGQSGKCTADCSTNGASCGNGLLCDGRGRCVQGAIFGPGTGVTGLTDASACLADTRQGEGLPVDIYIMNDQSQSMTCAIPTGGDRWTAMTNALTNFVKSPNAAGLGVGIQYFGQVPGGMGRRDNGQDSCDPAVYQPADVEIAPLPGNAQAIITSLGNHMPWTYTPTPAAIDGALAHAKTWAAAHPSHIVAVVLATDGQPNLCGNAQDRIGSVAQSAAAGLAGTPSIRTYVIGTIGGSSATGGQGCNLDPNPPNKADLDRVAKGGGTGSAFIVDAAMGDASAQFLDALGKIRGAAVDPCQYVVPSTTTSGRQVNPQEVNVTLTPSGGKTQELLQASDANSCPASGGWYYDDPSAPTKLLLCPATCNTVKADAKASVNILMGCKTNTVPTR
jgi:hypothetical protein